MLDRVFRTGGEAESALRDAMAETDFADETVKVGDEADEGPVVRFVNEMIARAVHEGASDIHVEPTSQELGIRFRVDGVLRDTIAAPHLVQSRIVSRLKIFAEMDIADRRAPQDGRASIVVDGRPVDLRVVSFPTAKGEAVVVRLLDKAGTTLNIEELEFLPSSLEVYRRSFRRSSGALIVTGPTGSGKSTTLYATLQELNDRDRSIITIEDPVEYEIDGIKQVQIDPKAGVTFASALRALLRADPDVVLVGEVRDQDTARLAIDAALTGHLVMTSLHSNSAAATPARLVKIGVEPFLVISAVQCIVAQRLARRLCDRCKEPTAIRPELLTKLGWNDDLPLDAATFFRPVGCSMCGESGYHGRFALHEVMPITEAVGDAIADSAPAAQIEALAIKDGMTTLVVDGVLKAARGLTSVEELLRVAG
jgi:type IV pilus assembly protein PilB